MGNLAMQCIRRAMDLGDVFAKRAQHFGTEAQALMTHVVCLGHLYVYDHTLCPRDLACQSLPTVHSKTHAKFLPPDSSMFSLDCIASILIAGHDKCKTRGYGEKYGHSTIASCCAHVGLANRATAVVKHVARIRCSQDGCL